METDKRMERQVGTAIISDEASQDLRRAASQAREFGLDALEIRSVGE